MPTPSSSSPSVAAPVSIFRIWGDMADLPLERLNPAKPFEFTIVDLFGPYEVRDEVKKNTKLKVWGIVFSCMVSRAMHMDLVSDQSSKGFLMAYQQTDCGWTLEGTLSEPGPPFQDLYTYLNRLEKTKLEDEATKHGTELT